MANTYVDYTAVASQTDYNFSFEYLRDEHVKVKVNGALVSNYTIVTSPTPTKIRFNTAPAAGAEIRIYRDSRGDFSPLVDFVDGSVLTENELDEAYKHNLFSSQEASEGTGNELLNKKGGANYDAEGNRIINLGAPANDTDAANKAYTNQAIDNAIALGGSPAIVSLGHYDVTALGSTLARSLQDRFTDVVNVLDYGVKNDGTEPSGDSNASRIQTALNAHSNIYFPEGDYRISASIILSGRTYSIFGTTDTRIFVDQSTWPVDGGIFKSLESDRPSGSTLGISIKHIKFYGYDISGSIPADFVSGSSALLFAGVSSNNGSAVIEDCSFEGFGIGIRGSAWWASTINRCRFANYGKGVGVGINLSGDLSGDNGWNGSLSLNSLTIENCWFNKLDFAIQTGDQAVQKVRIINNTFEQCDEGVLMQQSDGTSLCHNYFEVVDHPFRIGKENVDTVTSTTITNAGANYDPDSPPSVTFSGGGGSGATGTAIVNSGGFVTGIIITDKGSNYTSAPTITIANPPTGSNIATAYAVLGPNAKHFTYTNNYLNDACQFSYINGAEHSVFMNNDFESAVNTEFTFFNGNTSRYDYNVIEYTTSVSFFPNIDEDLNRIYQKDSITNGIIESNSNANGNYIKYADGTLICTATENGTCANIRANAFGHTAGNMYGVNLSTKTYAHAFVGTPSRVSLASNGGTDSASDFYGIVTSIYDSATQFRNAIAHPTQNQTLTVKTIAIGRWK